jgi:hypothetical protein
MGRRVLPSALLVRAGAAETPRAAEATPPSFAGASAGAFDVQLRPVGDAQWGAARRVSGLGGKLGGLRPATSYEVVATALLLTGGGGGGGGGGGESAALAPVASDAVVYRIA